MKKLSLWLCAIALSFSSFVAFAKDLTIGFSQIGAESSWRTAETKSIKDEAEKRGIKLQFSDAQQKQENQIKAIRSFIAQGVDGIILAPVVQTGWERVLKEAKKAGIPVVLVDRTITVSDDSLYTSFVGSDLLFEGRMAGAWVVQDLEGYGNVVELQGTPGAAAALDRQKGFKDMIQYFPGIKITQSQTGDFTRAKGKEVMEAFLKSDKNIDLLFSHNDDMAIGAIQAIKEAGLKPGKDIKIISVDGVKDGFTAMVNGELNATVECNPLLGPLAFDTLEQAIDGKKVAKVNTVRDRIITQDEAASLIDARQY